MDGEQNGLKFLGTFDIFKELIKIILSWPKIFILITLAFILPHSCLYLALISISKPLVSKIFYNLILKQIIGYDDQVSNSISLELAFVSVAYFILSAIFSLLTFSTITYIVTCIYTCKEITFRKVMSVVPKVWKRFMITYLCKTICIMYAMFFQCFVAFMFASLYVANFFKQAGLAGIVMVVTVLLFMGTISMVGKYYVITIWQLADVVSVMENNGGFVAMKRSNDLMKGKMRSAFAIVLVMSLFGTPITLLFQNLGEFGIVRRICFGIPSLMLWALLSLFSHVVKTIFYLVCKSYHHESIDMSSLADHLQLNGDEIVPLKNSEVMQLHHLQV